MKRFAVYRDISPTYVLQAPGRPLRVSLNNGPADDNAYIEGGRS